MKSLNVLAAVAAAGIVLTPIAAQAGTRASSAGIANSSAVSAVPGGRATTGVSHKNGVISDTVLAFIGVATFGAIIAILVSDNDKKKSAGTG